jgi:hypothetical protein
VDPAERAMSVCSQPSRKTYDEWQSDCCPQHLRRLRYPHKEASAKNPLPYQPSDPSPTPRSAIACIQPSAKHRVFQRNRSSPEVRFRKLTF